MQNMPDCLTVADLAQRWGRSKYALLTLRHRDKTPPAFKIGRTLFFHKAGVDAYERSMALEKGHDASFQDALDAIAKLPAAA